MKKIKRVKKMKMEMKMKMKNNIVKRIGLLRRSQKRKENVKKKLKRDGVAVYRRSE